MSTATTQDLQTSGARSSHASFFPLSSTHRLRHRSSYSSFVASTTPLPECLPKSGRHSLAALVPIGSGQQPPYGKGCEGAHPPSQLSRLPIGCRLGRSAARLPVPFLSRRHAIAHLYIVQLRLYTAPVEVSSSRAIVQRLNTMEG